MNAAEIRTAVDAGLVVHWSNASYRVIRDSSGQYLIQCESNGHCVGLTWLNGVTLNGEPGDFYVAPSAAPGDES